MQIAAKLFSAILVLVVATVAHSGQPPAAAKAPDQRILVLSGHGLLPSYGSAQNRTEAVMQADAHWRRTTRLFIRPLEEGLSSASLVVDTYENFSSSQRAADLLPELVQQHGSSALIQVAVEHVKDPVTNAFFLSATYTPLHWKKDAAGRSYFVIGDEATEKYELMSAIKDYDEAEIPAMASRYLDRLRRQGVLPAPAPSP